MGPTPSNSAPPFAEKSLGPAASRLCPTPWPLPRRQQVLLDHPELMQLAEPDVAEACKGPLQEAFVALCGHPSPAGGGGPRDRVSLIQRLVHHPDIRLDLEAKDASGATVFSRAVMAGDLEV